MQTPKFNLSQFSSPQRLLPLCLALSLSACAHTPVPPPRPLSQHVVLPAPSPAAMVPEDPLQEFKDIVKKAQT